jgi:hypothetical protein
MSYDNHPFEDQQIYIQGVFLEGVQSYSNTFTLPDDDIIPLGYGTPVAGAPNAPLEGEVHIKRLVVSAVDPVIEHFEGDDMHGWFAYDAATAYMFEKAYITNYACTCAVNELPELDLSLRTYGVMEPVDAAIAKIVSPDPGDPIKLTTASDINLTITDQSDPAQNGTLNVSTNAVQSFEYDIDIDWEPLYSIGSKDPQTLYNRGPAKVEALIEIELNDAVPPNFRELVCSPIVKDITLDILSCGGGEDAEVVRSFSCPCAKLVEYTQMGEIDGVMRAELRFKSTKTPVSLLETLLTV